MRSAALIRYDMHRLAKELQSFPAPGQFPAQEVKTSQSLLSQWRRNTGGKSGSVPGWKTSPRAKTEARLAKLIEELPIAERRELKRLANYLTYKADIYGPQGRIYSCDAKWTVREDVLGKAYLFHGDKVIDPEQLCDGHGRTITLPD